MSLDASNSTVAFLWEPSPSSRGTFQVVTSCLSTLFICVWSAVHTDVPRFRLSASQSILRMINWMLVALFVPEFLLVHAAAQLSYARAIYKDVTRSGSRTTMNRRRLRIDPILHLFSTRRSVPTDHEELTEPPPWHRQYSVTLVHAFYALMGGFAFEFKDAPTKQLRERTILTARGYRFLMRVDPGIIRSMSEADIKDKSKSSALQKGLLLVQATWFCLNCVGRLAQRLPISLLEVSTIAHCLCAIVTCAVWFYKPHNVEEPTLLQGRRALEALALMNALDGDENIIGSAIWQMYDATITPGAPPAADSLVSAASDVEKAYALSSRGEYVQRVRKGLSPGFKRPPGSQSPEQVDLVACALHRTKDPFPILEDLDSWYDDDFKASYLRTKEQKTVLLGDDGWGFHADIGLLMWPVLGLVYGAPHLLGWIARFPTAAEKYIWSFASGTISASPLVLLVMLFLAGLSESRLPSWVENWWYIPFGLTIFLLYPLCALYLIVESIRQLFYLEPAAYELPNWSTYIPHFS